jgi:Putative restriction endonuclease
MATRAARSRWAALLACLLVMLPTLPSDRAPAPGGGVTLSYRVSEFSEHWVIPEEIPVPESAWHDGCVELFRALLRAWLQRSGRDAAAFRDIAVRTRQELPRVGFNPDVCLVEPAPNGAAELESLKLWEHSVPRLVFEVVTASHPYKDYALVPEKCAVVGVSELIVFDPLLAGPRALGGPCLLQVWRRAADGRFERVYAGAQSTWSNVLGAFLVPDREARRVFICDQPDGSAPWLTSSEEAVAREQDAVAREQDAIARERAALARVAELEAELARRGG